MKPPKANEKGEAWPMMPRPLRYARVGAVLVMIVTTCGRAANQRSVQPARPGAR
jgi:hypothetical protein